MKVLKVTFLGKPLRNVYPHATAWQVFKYKLMRALRFLMKWTAIASSVVAILFGVYFYGMAEAANTTTVVNQIVPAQKETMAAVMARIAKCESGSMQEKNGSIVTNTNTNGTVDVGKFQINMSASHIKEMAKLGFNPLTEEGNEAYAKWLYENRGTSDWSSSQHCWQ